ncbi:MAG: tRNA (adenosine(37)-N6)-threonylcarbamoyltransferase complex ATPase subunit type 1 TsaE, partial [Gammaproteobacteria bacterium]
DSPAATHPELRFTMVKTFLANEAATQAFAVELAKIAHTSPLCLYFYGEIGTGKTTFIRAYLHALGVIGRVKSPSFAVIESYPLHDKMIYHIDLYRLEKAEEIEAIGLRDYFDSASICCVEWADRAKELLPLEDIAIHFEFYQGGRILSIMANTCIGVKICEQLSFRNTI